MCFCLPTEVNISKYCSNVQLAGHICLLINTLANQIAQSRALSFHKVCDWFSWIIFFSHCVDLHFRITFTISKKKKKKSTVINSFKMHRLM